MFEYKVEKYSLSNASIEMKKLAIDGWRVISVFRQIDNNGIIVVFERKA